MADIHGVIKHIIWGVLIASFVTMLLLGIILQDRLRRKIGRGYSMFSPLPAFKALGISEAYLLVVLACIGVMTVMLMVFLKNSGF